MRASCGPPRPRSVDRKRAMRQALRYLCQVVFDLRRWTLAVVSLSTALAGTSTALAGMQVVRQGPLSLGTPNAGRLVGGKLFRETRYMVMVPARAKSTVHWGLPGLLSVLDRASRIVARKFPGGVLEVGELSRRDGGPATLHLSHQNGRDADIAFYALGEKGEPARLVSYTRFNGAGQGKDDPSLRFDDERNWTFVRAILDDPHNEVRQIFISVPLRARLLAYAAATGVPRDVRAKAAKAMMQPGNALPHDDHFHIRISCPVEQLDAGCADLPLHHFGGAPEDFGIGVMARLWWRSRYDALNALPPLGWGPVSRLWSADLGLCKRADLSCFEQSSVLQCSEAGGEDELAAAPSMLLAAAPERSRWFDERSAIANALSLGAGWMAGPSPVPLFPPSRARIDTPSLSVPALASVFEDERPSHDWSYLPPQLAAAGAFGGVLPVIGAGDLVPADPTWSASVAADE